MRERHSELFDLLVLSLNGLKSQELCLVLPHAFWAPRHWFTFAVSPGELEVKQPKAD